MNTIKQLVETIKEGIQEKKGQDIVIADLSEIDGSIAKYFIICQGGSPTQVEAIAESVGDICRKNMGEKPVNVAGLGNDQWVAMDFVDVMAIKVLYYLSSQKMNLIKLKNTNIFL